MPRRKRTARTPLTPRERRKHSRDVLIARVMSLVVGGNSFASIARREHMPSVETLQRWRDTDSDFRKRYDVALTMQRHMMADAMVTMADRFAATQDGRARLKAVKLQIAARKWWLAEFDQEKRSDEKNAKPQRSPTDADIARLNEALRRIREAPPIPIKGEKNKWPDEREGDETSGAEASPDSIRAAPERPTHEARDTVESSETDPNSWHVRFDTCAPPPAPDDSFEW